MVNNLKFAVAAVSLLCSTSGAFAQSKLNCQVDPITGLHEATLDWQNTLGRERANGLCRRLPTSAPVVPSEELPSDYVTLRVGSGHSPLQADDSMVTEYQSMPRVPERAFGEVGEYIQIRRGG